MTNHNKPDDTERFVRAIERLFEMLVLHDLEEARSEIEKAGLNPDDVGRRIAQFAKEAGANSPLNWRNKAVSLKQEQEKIRLAQQHIRFKSNEELIQQIKTLLSKHGGDNVKAIAAYRNLETLQTEDLETLLTQIEFLISQSNDEGANED